MRVSFALLSDSTIFSLVHNLLVEEILRHHGLKEMSLFGTVDDFIDAPRKALGGAAGTIREVIARIPFQRGVIGTKRLLQVLMLPAHVVAHLGYGLVAGVLLSVAEAEIDVSRINGMGIRETAPGIYPQRWRHGCHCLEALGLRCSPAREQPAQGLAAQNDRQMAEPFF